ncbi:neuropathy target esterase sws isoform X3 [Schistocerca piceifrons]|uniref:neuropathy target esterase sws isoform X3 n=1 Tax=Schistocerca piceifrons TaxID=274613 RepID=UPI001F5FCA2B|nr:neuropathy target esterase sws isoform X3 [Schistocerca piceifrons]
MFSLNMLYLKEYLYGFGDYIGFEKWSETISTVVHRNLFMFQVVTVLLILYAIQIILNYVRDWSNKDLPEARRSGKRFRKRDKMMYYGRKIMRKVKSVASSQDMKGQRRKIAISKFAKQILLQMSKDSTPTQLKVLEPPAEYLEEDVTSKTDKGVPPDVVYMLQSIRVFGHFEKPVFLKLCRRTEIINVPAGSFLFKIGNPDENVYIVQSGKLVVFTQEGNTPPVELKIVRPGETVTSLLSFTDVLTGHTSSYKTVSARAAEDSTVLRLPMSAFQDLFEDYPDIFIRVMQVIMVRLQRVTFTALHQYLGLSSELVNQNSQRKEAKTPLAVVKKQSKNVLQKTSDFAQHELFLTRNQTDNFKAATDSEFHQFSLSNPQPDMLDSTPCLPTAPASRCSPDTLIQSDSASYDEAALVEIATAAFVKELGLQDSSVLSDGKVEIREVSAGTYLMKEESHKDVALVYLVTGALVVSQKLTDVDEEVLMFKALPGEIVGGLAVLTGEPSFFTIRAETACIVALMSKTTFYEVMCHEPRVVLHIAHTVVRRLSPFVRQVDFGLDWVFVETGRAVYRQGDESDSTFIVLSGRLRSVITHSNGKKEQVGEYGKGDLIGIVEMVTHTPRGTTVMAVRDSELAKLPEGLFNAIKLKYPVVVTRLIHLLGHRILGSWQRPHGGVPVDSRPSHGNFSTVAIVPISDDVPLVPFTYELYHALRSIGPTLRLTSDVIRNSLGPSILDPKNDYRLTSWCLQQEDQHKITLYQCDFQFTPWTQRCVRQADCILIVGLAEKEPTVGKIEKEIERLAVRTQKELVLLHRDRSKKPKNTVAWLNNRNWVSAHHHILCKKRLFTERTNARLEELYKRVLQTVPDAQSDFSRLARWLTGTSIGLVLGGGGARGAAHVGMVKAIEEAGIPIDMVGGVSIGAFMGALWCMERDVTTMTQKARDWSKRLTHWWRQMLDLTYPVTSMFTGREFNHTIRSTFGDTHIEDLWVPYFTVTTDITESCMRVHTHGSLWRYIRASMSLSGYMPPLCDPSDGHLLLDGGYVNNLPADVMRNLGAKHVLAVDVGSQDDIDLTNYGDCLSGWWLLWKRWNPFATPVKVPNLPDIQSRLAYVSCVRQLEEVKSSDYCEYIRPPIDKYKTLQFGSFDEIKDVGYHHGSTYFAGLRKAGCLPFLKTETSKEDFVGRSETKCDLNRISGYSFTDLAQLVCRVPQRKRQTVTDDEYIGDKKDAEKENIKESFKIVSTHNTTEMRGAVEGSEEMYHLDTVDSKTSTPQKHAASSLSLSGYIKGSNIAEDKNSNIRADEDQLSKISTNLCSTEEDTPMKI